MSDAKQILVGKIVAPQGIRGEVRVQTYSENPADFKKFKIQSQKFNSEDFKFVRAVPNSTVVIAKINVDEEGELAQAFKIRSIPQLYICKNGEVVKNISGYVSADVILEALKLYFPFVNQL